MRDINSSRHSSFQFRPLLTVALIPVLVLLIALGVWQTQRHFWKQELLREYRGFNIDEPFNIRTQPLSIVDYWSLNGQGNQPYIAWIQIDPSTFVLVGNDRIEGIPGKYLYGLVDFYEIEQRYWTRLGFVPVNRFADFADFDPETMIEQTTMVLQVKEDDPSRAATGARNDPERDLWLYANSKEFNQAFDREATEGYVLNAIDNNSLEGIMPQPLGARLPNNHWHYALTWFALAIVLLVFYVLMSREQKAGEEEKG